MGPAGLLFTIALIAVGAFFLKQEDRPKAMSNMTAASRRGARPNGDAVESTQGGDGGAPTRGGGALPPHAARPVTAHNATTVHKLRKTTDPPPVSASPMGSAIAYRVFRFDTLGHVHRDVDFDGTLPNTLACVDGDKRREGTHQTEVECQLLDVCLQFGASRCHPAVLQIRDRAARPNEGNPFMV